jgi:predicted phosphohydrolase
LCPLVARIAAEQPDLTVLAGDLGEGLDNVRRCLSLFQGMPGEVAVLVGNHDLWVQKGGPSSLDLWERALPDAVREARMLWLEDAIWRRGDVALVGSIAWYDYSAADPTLEPQPKEFFAAYKAQKFPDAFHMDWAYTDEEFSTLCGEALCARLRQLEADETVRMVFVITHDPVFDPQMLRKPEDPKWGMTNAFFGNMTIGERLKPMRKLHAVISGHTHVGRQALVPRTAGKPIIAWVIPSDYHTPAYVVAPYDVPDR